MCPIHFCHSAGLTIIISPPDFTRFIFYLFIYLLFFLAQPKCRRSWKETVPFFSECILFVGIIFWMNPSSVVWLEVSYATTRFDDFIIAKKKKPFLSNLPYWDFWYVVEDMSPSQNPLKNFLHLVTGQAILFFNKYKMPGLFIVRILRAKNLPITV